MPRPTTINTATQNATSSPPATRVEFAEADSRRAWHQKAAGCTFLFSDHFNAQLLGRPWSQGSTLLKNISLQQPAVGFSPACVWAVTTRFVGVCPKQKRKYSRVHNGSILWYIRGTEGKTDPLQKYCSTPQHARIILRTNSLQLIPSGPLRTENQVLLLSQR